MTKTIGLDIGGTKIQGAVIDEKGEILKTYRLETCAREGKDKVLDNISKIIDFLKTDDIKAGYVSNDVLKDLAGKEGVAHTTLRPAGIAKIDGNLVDVVTEGDFIDAGSPIVVLRVVGGRNIVRKRD